MGTVYKLAQAVWNTSVDLITKQTSRDCLLETYLLYEEIKAFSAEYLLKDILTAEMTYIQSNNFLLNDNNQLNLSDKNFESVFISLLNNNGFAINLKDNDYSSFDLLTRLYMLLNLNHPLNISSIATYIEKTNISNYQIPLSVKRLIGISNIINKSDRKLSKKSSAQKPDFLFTQAENLREQQELKYPAKLVILAEGATEETLLPVFADKVGLNFSSGGIQLVGAGGKNKVAKVYREYCRQLNLPILVMLDADAAEIAEEIRNELREIDKIILIDEGEFEDLLSINLICRAMNSYYRIETVIKPEDIKPEISMAQSLSELWKKKGLGEFDKIKFARIVADAIKDKSDLSPSLISILSVIAEMSGKTIN